MLTKYRTLSCVLSVACVVLSGFAAGVINGLLGAAGGLLLIALLPRLPLPRFLSLQTPDTDTWDRRDVLACVLCVMLPISAVSAGLYWQRGVAVDTQTLTAMLVPAALGGLVGALLLDRLPKEALRKIFALVVVFSGVRMLF